MTWIILQCVASLMIGVGLIFMAGYWWRDGNRMTAILSLIGGLVMLLGQVASFLAWLADHLK